METLIKHWLTTQPFNSREIGRNIGFKIEKRTKITQWRMTIEVDSSPGKFLNKEVTNTNNKNDVKRVRTRKT